MKYGEWKIWNGGECPVADGTKVQVQFSHWTRYDAMLRTPSNAGSLEWEWISANSSGPFEIIAYRVAIEPVRETVTLCSAWHDGEMTYCFKFDPRDYMERKRPIKLTLDLVDGEPDLETLKAEWME